MDLLILSADDVRRALPMADAIQAMKEAYSQLSAGEAAVPLRSRVDVENHKSLALFMPAYLKTTDQLAIKVVTVSPANLNRGLPMIHAVVVALDPDTGQPLALLEGGSLTAIRTGAGSGAATDILARPDASVAAILGSGVQARTQLEAVCTVRRISQVRVFSPTKDHAVGFAEEMAGAGPIPDAVHVVDDADEAVEGADIVCAATTSSSPVFDGSRLAPGAHVNTVGSFTPQMQEVDVTTLRRSRVFLDSREAALEEAGDLIQPIQRGEYSVDDIRGEIGEVLGGQVAGRTQADQITLFKSVGVAVQDAAAAGWALRTARSTGLGRVVSL